jgi:MFS family permease
MDILTRTTPATAGQAPARPASPPRRWLVGFAAYTALSNATFSQAVWMIYLAAHGYSSFAIGLFEMGFHLAKLVAEVPTGVFADLIGRRASLIVSSAVGACAALLLLVPMAPLIALSFALQGVAFAFRGGADSALLWSLAGAGGTSDVAARFSRLFSAMFLVTLFAQTAGVGMGGLLSAVHPLLPFLCAGAALALAIPPLLLLPEQRPERRERPRPLAHVHAGLAAAWRDPPLLGLLLLSGLTAGVVTTTGYYTQLYFRGLGFSLAAIGLIFAATILPDALCAAAAPRVMRVLPRRVVLAVFTGLEALGLLALGTGVPALGLIGFLALLHIGDSVLYPAITTYLNERTPEAQRATVLSLETGLFSALMIVLFPLFGLGLTHVSYTVAYRWTCAALVAGSAAIAGGMWLLRRQARQAARADLREPAAVH